MGGNIIVREELLSCSHEGRTVIERTCYYEEGNVPMRE